MAGFDSNNGINDTTPPVPQSGAVWRAGYGQVAPGAIAAADGNNQPVPQSSGVWRAGYNGVAPGAIAAANGTSQAEIQQQQPSNGGVWRAGYNQVAPDFNTTGTDAATLAAQQQNGQQPSGQQPWRPADNTGTPIFTGNDGTTVAPNIQAVVQPGTIYQPGSNGQRTSYTGSNTPIFSAPQYDTTTGQPTVGNGAPYTPPYDRPPTPMPGNNVPGSGVAYNPGGGRTTNNGWPQGGGQPAPGDAGNGGTAYNPSGNPTGTTTPTRTDASSTPTDTAPTQPIGVFAAAITGGIGGAFGGAFAPPVLNKLAEQITKSAPVAGKGWLDESGWARKIFPKTVVDQAADLQGKAAAKAGDLGAGGMLNNAAVGWQNNFEARFMARPDLQKLLDTNTTALKAFDGKDLAALPEAEAAQLKQLQATQAVLARPPILGPLAPGAVAPAAELNPQLFTAAGKDAVGKLIADQGHIPGAAADPALVAHIDNLNKAFPEATATGTKPALMERPGVSDFLKGAAFFGGTIAADQVVGNVLGSKNGAFHLDTIAIPEAFLMGGSWQQRIGYGAAAVIGSNLIDKVMPASDHPTLSRIFAPNAVDGITMGAAFTLPAEDPRLRAMMVGGAWGFSRLRNMTNGEAMTTTGLGLGATGAAMYLGKINPELGMGLLVAEGGAYIMSRVFHPSTPSS